MARALRVDKTLSIRSTAERVYQAISTKAGLASWFADAVSSDVHEGDLVEFTWGRGRMARRSRARVLRVNKGKSVMLRWEDSLSHSRDDYFSVTVKKEKKGVTVTVVDFATKDSRDELDEIWDECLAKLKESLESA